MKVFLSFLYAPIIYFSLKYYGISLNDVLSLKVLPTIVALVFSIVLIISYIQKKSLILYFAKKFTKHDIDEEEEKYIHKSTLFWIGITLINTLIHLSVLLDTNTVFWLFYSSIGGYMFIAFAGLIQFLHRKYVFKKR